MAVPYQTHLVQLLLATLFGGIIGWERFLDGKPAGLRTMTLVSLGSTGVLLAVGGGHGDVSASSSPELTRVVQGVITGVGFLGAGSILHSGRFVQGLTTAATIWVVAGIGIAVGMGQPWLALEVTVLTFVVLRLFRLFEVWSGGKAMTQHKDRGHDPTH
jgi:putative Mg2+ transporter-C (MgtC) family protein